MTPSDGRSPQVESTDLETQRFERLEKLLLKSQRCEDIATNCFAPGRKARGPRMRAIWGPVPLSAARTTTHPMRRVSRASCALQPVSGRELTQ